MKQASSLWQWLGFGVVTLGGTILIMGSTSISLSYHCTSGCNRTQVPLDIFTGDILQHWSI